MVSEAINRYRAFGLSISSDVQLDELMPDPDADGAVDLTICRGAVGYSVPARGYPHFDFTDPAGVLMVWPAAAGVRVSGGNLITIEPFPDVPENYLAFPILGPAMGWLLHARGLYVLHASAMVFNGRSIGLLGDKGAGKSTTAAGFLRAGARLLTDDLLAVDVDEGGGATFLPAFAQLKLNSDASQDHGIPEVAILPPIMPNFEKRQHRLPGMHETPIRGDALFVLERGGDEPAIEWLDGGEALSALVRFAYNVRFEDATPELRDLKRCFRQAAAISRQVRIGRLRIPNDASCIDAAVRLVDETLAAEVR